MDEKQIGTTNPILNRRYCKTGICVGKT